MTEQTLAQRLKDKDLESELWLIIGREGNEYIAYRGAPEKEEQIVSKPFRIGKCGNLDGVFSDLERENEYFSNYAHITFGLLKNELTEEMIGEIKEYNAKRAKPYLLVEISLAKVE